MVDNGNGKTCVDFRVIVIDLLKAYTPPAKALLPFKVLDPFLHHFEEFVLIFWIASENPMMPGKGNQGVNVIGPAADRENGDFVIPGDAVMYRHGSSCLNVGAMKAAC